MKKIIIIFTVAVLALIGWYIYRINLSPLEVVMKDKSPSDSIFYPNEVLYQSAVSEEQYIIIFKNNNENLCNVLLEKSFFGYEVLDFNGEMSTNNTTIPVGMHFGWYKREKGWVGFGVIYNDEVEEIYIDGTKSTIIEVNHMRIWYLHGERELNELNTRILDIEGNEIIH